MKKTVTKQVLPLLLVLAMVLSIIPVAATQALAVDETIAELKQEFPDGKYWNHLPGMPNNPDGVTSTPCDHSEHDHTYYDGRCGCNSTTGAPIYFNGIQCYGYALKVAYDYYGSSPMDWPKTTDLDLLKAGDYIRFPTNGTTGHSIWVTAVNDDVVTFTDCNWFDKCQIRWDVNRTKNWIENYYVDDGAVISQAPYEAEDETLECEKVLSNDFVNSVFSFFSELVFSVWKVIRLAYINIGDEILSSPPFQGGWQAVV